LQVFSHSRNRKKDLQILHEKAKHSLRFQEGEGINKKLSDLGMTDRKGFVPAEPEIYCYKSPDTHGQVLGVATLLKKRIDQQQRIDENTVIVLPSSESLLPLFHQALCLLDPDNYNVSSDTLSRGPLSSLFSIT